MQLSLIASKDRFKNIEYKNIEYKNIEYKNRLIELQILINMVI